MSHQIEMLKFMALYSMIIYVSAIEFDNYGHETEEISQFPLEHKLDTEYLTFSAPDDFNDSKDVKRLSGILRPQRVIFIRTPEKNIFSLTAEQLAKKESLNIFVLRRETNSQGLLSQLQEIRQRVAQKPNVYFIKYKNTEDVTRAKEALYKDLESIPGTINYHENTQIPVYDYDAKTQQFYEKSETPVIFMIIKHQKNMQVDKEKLSSP